MGLGDEFHYFFIAREGGQQRVKAPYKHPQTSAFHLACVWKSGFLPLTLNDLTLSEGSCFSGRVLLRSPLPLGWGWGEVGPGGGRLDSSFSCSGWGVAVRGPVKTVWAISAGRPPTRTVHRPVLRRPRSRGSNWEHEMHCFFSFFFFPTDLKEILLWTDQACLLFENSPWEADLPWPWRGNRWWPLGKWVVFKAALSLGCPWNRRQIKLSAWKDTGAAPAMCPGVWWGVRAVGVVASQRSCGCS